MLYATMRQRKIHVKNPTTVIQHGINVDELILEFDDEWALMDAIIAVFTLKYSEKEEAEEGDTTKTALVSKEVTKKMLHTFGKPVMVPWECLAHTGRLMVSCTGYVEGQKVMTTMYPDSYWNVVQCGPVNAELSVEPTPTLYEQVVAAAGKAIAAADAALEAEAKLLQDKENGVFDGEEGKTPRFEIGDVQTGAAGSQAQVSMSGTDTEPVLNFVIPRGKAGPAATVEIVGVDSLPNGSPPTVTEAEGSTEGARKYRLGIPEGDQGIPGMNGSPGRAGRGVSLISANADGTWTIYYTDGTSSVVTNDILTNAILDAREAADYAKVSAGDASRWASEARSEALYANSQAMFASREAARATVAASAANHAVENLDDASLGKVDKSGWNPNKYLGTDAAGKVVEKDAPEGDSTGDLAGYYTPVVAQPNGTGSMVVEYVASQEEMPAVDPVEVILPQREIDNKTLVMKDGILQVNTTENVEEDNTLPITSAAVYATVGNISAILDTI